MFMQAFNVLSMFFVQICESPVFSRFRCLFILFCHCCLVFIIFHMCRMFFTLCLEARGIPFVQCAFAWWRCWNMVRGCLALDGVVAIVAV